MSAARSASELLSYMRMRRLKTEAWRSHSTCFTWAMSLPAGRCSCVSWVSELLGVLQCARNGVILSDCSFVEKIWMLR